MKAISSLFVVVIVAVAAVHIFFSVQYDTMNPCKAAIERIKQDKKSGGLLDQALGELIGFGQDLIGDERLASELQLQEGTLGCYQIAITGASK